MKTYQITGSTNSYIAARDIAFNGKTSIVIKEGLTLHQAHTELLSMFNDDYYFDCGYACTWAVARRKKPHSTSTFNDGTRSYEWDSRTYRIELQNN